VVRASGARRVDCVPREEKEKRPKQEGPPLNPISKWRRKQGNGGVVRTKKGKSAKTFSIGAQVAQSTFRGFWEKERKDCSNPVIFAASLIRKAHHSARRGKGGRLWGASPDRGRMNQSSQGSGVERCTCVPRTDERLAGYDIS